MPNYDFSQLSPADFESLILGLIQKEWNVRLESFKTGRDQGIDLRYACPNTSEKTIIQCKHFLASGFSKLLSELIDKEYKKVRILNPKRYILVTSVGLTPANKERIIAALHPYISNSSDIFGQTEINNLLERHPEIEKSNYKLWLTSHAILERVLHNAEVSQTEFAVERITKKLPLYVQSAAFPRAMDILDKENVVVISGEPGIGKTTLAEIILYDFLSREFMPVVIRNDLREGLSRFRRGIPQIFYYDDFLGQTFLRERHGFLLRNEDAALVEFVNAVQQSNQSKLILTTREHILSNAFLASERLRRSPLIESKCILEIRDYHKSERAKILYNHIYFGDLPSDYIFALLDDNFYEEIYSHKNFNPRLIEWLSTFRQIKRVPSSQYKEFIIDTLANPQELWSEAFNRQISDAARSLVIALFSLGGSTHIIRLEVAWKAICIVRSQKYNWPAPIEGFNGALKEIEGSFVALTNSKIEFINPSVKDFIEGVCCKSPELVEDIVDGATSFDQLFRIWQFSQSPKSHGVSNTLKKTLASFESAASRTLAMPFKQIIIGKDFRAIRELDLFPESRLRALITLADFYKSQTLIALAPAVLENISAHWKEDGPDFREAVLALGAFETAKWSSLNKSNSIYEELRKITFEKIKRASSCSDFIALDDFMETTPEIVSDIEKNCFLEGLHRYAEEYFDEDLLSVSHIGDLLSEMAAFIEKADIDYGYDLKVQFKKVSDALEHYEEYESRSADDQYDRWKDSRDFDRQDDEAIADMFDGLRSR